MATRLHHLKYVLCASALLIPTIATAQEAKDDDLKRGSSQSQPVEPIGQGNVGPDGQPLPSNQGDLDPVPPPPTPVAATPGDAVTEQAGIGGNQSYARRGVLELGGFAGLTAAKDYLAINVAPTAGYFILDNIELSALLDIAYSDVNSTSGVTFTALVEPSVHIPFTTTLFGFVGLGLGLGYTATEGPGSDPGLGFAVAPRLGLNVLVGRSGILTPALSLQYITNEATTTSQGTVLAVSTRYGANIGYTVMW